MSEIGYAVLCSDDGVVTTAFGETIVDCGASLLGTVARDSRERLMKMMVEARQSPQSALLVTAGGESILIHCASQGGRTLVVAGATPGEIRRRCLALASDPAAAPLAEIVMETTVPDDMSLSYWEELSRLNNELATAQRELARTNARLRWLNDQKNQLLGMAAHDLRNPMSVIRGYLQFMTEDAHRLSGEQLDMLDRIRGSVDTMMAIIDDVLDFSAIESGTVRLEASTFDLSAFVREIAEANAPIGRRKHVTISVAAPQEPAPVTADRRKLSQVLNNLVSNAIKYSAPRSGVTISAAPWEDRETRIAVIDRGPGLSSDQINNLFQPFVRVGPEATAGEKSTGLGLTIARRIVEAHQGRIEVDSEPGRGTTFTVVLPAGREVETTVGG